jgi:hypothetical protein
MSSPDSGFDLRSSMARGDHCVCLCSVVATENRPYDHFERDIGHHIECHDRGLLPMTLELFKRRLLHAFADRGEDVIKII